MTENASNYQVTSNKVQKIITVTEQDILVSEEQIAALLTKDIESHGQYKVVKIHWDSKPQLVDDGFGGTTPGRAIFDGAKVQVKTLEHEKTQNQ
jgi:hypothetical protein